MQADLQILLQLGGGFPICAYQRSEDRARPSALAVDEHLVGQLAEAVGDQPLEIGTASGPSQPDCQVLHLAEARLRFRHLFGSRLKTGDQAEDKQDERDEYRQPPPDHLRERAVHEPELPGNKCGRDHHRIIDGLTQREGQQGRDNDNSGHDQQAAQAHHIVSPQ